MFPIDVHLEEPRRGRKQTVIASSVQAGPLAGVDAAPIAGAAAVDDVEPPRARAGRHENEEPHGPRPRARAAG